MPSVKIEIVRSFPELERLLLRITIGDEEPVNAEISYNDAATLAAELLNLGNRP